MKPDNETTRALPLERVVDPKLPLSPRLRPAMTWEEQALVWGLIAALIGLTMFGLLAFLMCIAWR